jgi:hypothetical protein
MEASAPPPMPSSTMTSAPYQRSVPPSNGRPARVPYRYTPAPGSTAACARLFRLAEPGATCSVASVPAPRLPYVPSEKNTVIQYAVSAARMYGTPKRTSFHWSRSGVDAKFADRTNAAGCGLPPAPGVVVNRCADHAPCGPFAAGGVPPGTNTRAPRHRQPVTATTVNGIPRLMPDVAPASFAARNPA